MSQDLKEAQQEIQMLLLALRQEQQRMNDLIGACTGPDGKPVAPPQKTLMQMRGYLPSSFSNSFKKQG